jgi:hypothetical protein
MKLMSLFKRDGQIARKTYSIILVLLLFLSISILISCSTNQPNRLSQTIPLSGTTPYQTNEILLTSTQTPTMANFAPTMILTPLIKTINPIYDQQITIDVTQGPVKVSTVSPNWNGYLYKNAVVRVWLGNNMDDIDYLNLDDLSDNGFNNSDVEIEMNTGNMVTYRLRPINNAYYFYPNNSTLDYDSCSKYFPVTGVTDIDYYGEAFHFIEGKPYCVLTNEGLIKNSIKINDEDYSKVLSVKVTVYSKQNE